MRKAGGIIAIIAGVLAVFASIATFMVGGIGMAFEGEGASTVVALGWGGLFASFAAIILGAVALGSKGRAPGILLIISSILGAIIGGTLVAICMVLALVGGILAASEAPVRREKTPEQLAR